MDQRISPSRESLQSVGEVAEWLGCTEPMVSRLNARGQEAGVAVGRTVRLEPRNIDEGIDPRQLGRVR
jgi:hypothetical protein